LACFTGKGLMDSQFSFCSFGAHFSPFFLGSSEKAFH